LLERTLLPRLIFLTKSETNVSRRTALKYLGAGVAGVVVGGIGGYALGTSSVPTPGAPLQTTATVTAPQNGPMTLAWWGGPELDGLNPVFSEFKKQTGADVQVIVHSGGSANIIPKIAAAWPNVYIDSTGINGNGAYSLADQGFTVPLTASDMPNMSQYADNTHVVYNGKTYGMIFATNSCVIVYRSDKVSQPITSLRDLLRPELKGKVAIGDPSVAAGTYLIAWALEYGGDEKNIDPGFAALKQLGDMGNLSMIWSDEPVALSSLASGEVWAMEYCDYGTGGYVAPNAAQYPWLKIVRNPAAGKSPFWGDAFAITNGPRQDLAKKFWDIFLSQDMQAKFAPVNGEPSTHPGVAVDPKLAPWINGPAELAQYGYRPDLATIVHNWSDWKTRFDKDIRPLVKA